MIDKRKVLRIIAAAKLGINNRGEWLTCEWIEREVRAIKPVKRARRRRNEM
jgi:hypothetical protein